MTTTWTNGYQTEVNYTYGYYRDLSPNFQKFCLLLNGIDSPDIQTNQTHCELGFGQGVSINIHAASTDANFYGTDFNPAHAAHANQLAQHSQTKSYFFDDSFEELLKDDMDIDKIEKYINKGVNINKKDEKGQTILFSLAAKRKLEALKILIRNGANLTLEDHHRKTVLNEAVTALYELDDVKTAIALPRKTDRSVSIDTRDYYTAFKKLNTDNNYFHILSDEAQFNDAVHRYSYLAKDETKEELKGRRLTQSKTPKAYKTKQGQKIRVSIRLTQPYQAIL